MIINMSNAPGEITQTYWDTTFFKKIHTIALDTVSGRLYLNGGNAGNGIMVLDVSQNPDAPTLLGHVEIPGGYVHDCYVRNDTVYASSGYEGYYVFDYKDPLNPKLLSRYPPEAITTTAGSPSMASTPIMPKRYPPVCPCVSWICKTCRWER